MRMQSFIFTLIFIFSHANAHQEDWLTKNRLQPYSRIAETWFSEDFTRMYIFMVLDPDEYSPYHYGAWGLSYGSHVFEVNMGYPREFNHSLLCPCNHPINLEK